MSKVHDTLFLPIGNGRIAVSGTDILFMNAVSCKGLSLLSQSNVTVQQFFKPLAQNLRLDGFEPITEIPNTDFDVVLLAVPKGKTEAQYMMAKAVEALRDNGILICAADNEANGKRLKSWLQDIGFDAVNDEAKHKARVCWVKKTGNHNLEDWLSSGEPQEIVQGRFISQPGLFGWDKIDQGSTLLLQYLPQQLEGKGADFGCGYGYLSRHLLQKFENIKELIAIDADFRAIKMAEINLKDIEKPKRFLWEDLTKRLSHLHNTLDWVVMNPPFHEGKSTNSDIGLGFIETAHHALHSGGALYMVANAHLPYEGTLQALFSDISALYEGEGFKVFAAVK